MAADADNHCAINVALYGAAPRWTMTERGRRHVHRDRQNFQVGRSALRWDGRELLITLDELAVPMPRRVRGTLRVRPQGLCSYAAGLDPAGAHRWGPIAPCAQVEVTMDEPSLRWQGHAYLDSNEGDEPIAGPFAHWDWMRATLPDGRTAVVYDVRLKASSSPRLIAAAFSADGTVEAFEPPPRHALPATGWRIHRHVRSAVPPQVQRGLEDTPFYARSLLQVGLCGESVTAVHETLSIPRLDSALTRLMLPWRMPRRG